MQSSEIDHFAEYAHRYCTFLEMAHQYQMGERILTLSILISDLYSAAQRLPELPPDHDARINTPAEINLSLEFGDLTLYWQVFDPYEWEPPVVGSLPDNLRDIYIDLRPGLGLFDEGHTDSAGWHWKLRFDTHWGDHAVDALRALHRANKRIREG